MPNCTECQVPLKTKSARRCRKCYAQCEEYRNKRRQIALTLGFTPPRNQGKRKIGWKLSKEILEERSQRMKIEYKTGVRIGFWKNKKQPKEIVEKRKSSMIGYKHSLETRK